MTTTEPLTELYVLVEPTAGGAFRVSDAGPLCIVAEGVTQEEAIERYRQAVADRLANGARLVALRLSNGMLGEEHSWMKFAGTLPDDDLTREWLQEMQVYRRQRDADDAALP